MALAGVTLAACGSSAVTPPAATSTGAAQSVPAQSVPSPASAWPQASFDASRDSATTAAGPVTGKVRWTKDLGSAVIEGPVIGTDGTVIVTPRSGEVTGLDPATGAIRWQTDIHAAGGSDLSSSPAVLADGTILVPGPTGELVALSGSGSLLWRQHIGSGQVLSPAIASTGRVYVVDMDGTATALLATATGAHRQWSLSVGSPAYGSPAITPDGTIVTTSGRSLIAITDQGSRGSVRWRFTAKSDVEVSPAVTAAGVIILGTNGDAEYGVTEAGHVAWTFPKKQWSYSSPVARPDGTVSFGDNDGRVYRLDGASGQGRVIAGPAAPSTALSSVGVGVWTAPVLDAAGHVYVGTASGHVEGFTATGTPLFDVNTKATVDSYPALGGDGTIYAASNNGTVYAIGD